jgi:hypothetical protein
VSTQTSLELNMVPDDQKTEVVPPAEVPEDLPQGVETVLQFQPPPGSRAATNFAKGPMRASTGREKPQPTMLVLPVSY